MNTILFANKKIVTGSRIELTAFEESVVVSIGHHDPRYRKVYVVPHKHKIRVVRTCLECLGDGEISICYNNNPDREGTEICTSCNGTGEIPRDEDDND